MHSLLARLFLLLGLSALPVCAAEPAAPAAPAPKAEEPAAPPRPVIIDVRSLAEWNQGHIEGALHIPHSLITDKIGAAVADKETPVTLYCRSGRRAGQAKAALEKLGYTKVTNGGGMEDLKKKLAPPP